MGASVFGQTVKLGLSNWETWVIYTSESVTWKLSSGNEVKVCLPYSLLLLVVVAAVVVVLLSWSNKSVPTCTRSVCVPC